MPNVVDLVGSACAAVEGDGVEAVRCLLRHPQRDGLLEAVLMGRLLETVGGIATARVVSLLPRWRSTGRNLAHLALGEALIGMDSGLTVVRTWREMHHQLLHPVLSP